MEFVVIQIMVGYNQFLSYYVVPVLPGVPVLIWINIIPSMAT